MIDFEGLEPGDIISTLSVGSGISSDDAIPGSISVYGEARTSNKTDVYPENRAMVFDADQASYGAGPADVSGGDTDLLKGDGNVAILTEDGDADDPGDNQHGGTFTFCFENFGFKAAGENTIGIDHFTAIDTEEPVAPESTEPSGTWTAYGLDGNIIGTGDVPSITNGETQPVDVEIAEGIAKFTVFLRGSGAIDNFCLFVLALKI